MVSISGVRCQLCDELVRVWMETQGVRWCVTSEGIASGHDGVWRVPGGMCSHVNYHRYTGPLIKCNPRVTLFVGYDVAKEDKKCNTACIFDEVSVGQWASRGQCNAINNWTEVKSEE